MGKRLCAVLACCLGICMGGVAHANPTGAQVVHGTVGFSRPVPHELQVTNSPNAIINWQGFSIAPHEITRFLQQSPASAVLNRVSGPDLSLLQGQLLSNGRVYLLNPQGIVVGPGAVIDTAGFVASTLNMTDEDFLAGRLDFVGDGASGAIVNRGYITAGRDGDVLLIAPEIENSGVIHTEGGRLILAAGEKVTLSSLDAKGVYFEVQAPEHAAVNLGRLLADGGAVGMFAGTLRHAGEIRASSVSVDEAGTIELTAKGDIRLEAGSTIGADALGEGDGGYVAIESHAGTTWVAGEVSARGAGNAASAPVTSAAGRGGRIRALGERVGLKGEARIDASGPAGGGEVLVGGDYQGANPSIRNAEFTVMAPGAAIRADAEESGDGGRVILWADGATRAYGDIQARGGLRAGDGGFVEVSGKSGLAFEARVDVSAPRGQSGTLLLDPSSLTIVDQSAPPGDQDANLMADNTVWWFDGDQALNTLNEATLEGLSGDVVLEATGQIVINDLISDGLLDMSGVALGDTFMIRSTGSGGIRFVNAGNEIRTGGGHIDLVAEGTGSLRNIGNLTILQQPVGSAVNPNIYLSQQAGALLPLQIVGALDAGLPGIDPYPGVNITADNVDVQGTITADVISFLPADPSVTRVDVGGADAAGVLGLSAAELTGLSVGRLEIMGADLRVVNDLAFGNVWFVLFANSGAATVTVAPGVTLTSLDTLDFHADEVDLAGSTLSANNLSFEPHNTGLSLGSTATPNLDLDGADLAALNGNNLVFESWFGMPNIRVAAPVTIPVTISNRVELVHWGSNGGIDVDASLSSHLPLTLKSRRSVNVNANITTSGQNITLNANRMSDGLGQVAIDGATIDSGGGDIVIGGGFTPLTASVFGIGTGGSDRYGVYLNNATLKAGAGLVSMRGVGYGGTTGAYGIYATGATSVQSTSGAIELDGTGGDGVALNGGVRLEGGGVAVTSLTGDVTVFGRGGGNVANSNVGVTVATGATLQSGSGTVLLNGTGGAGTNFNYGVWLTGAGSGVSSSGGVTLLGTGGASASWNNNSGIVMESGAVVGGTGSAPVVLTGTAAPSGGTNSTGVWLHQAGTTVSAQDGSLVITGTGGASAGSGRYGISMSDGADVHSIGSGSLRLEGSGGGTQLGVFTSGTGTTIGAPGMPGDITLAATSGSAFDSIRFLSGTTIQGSGRLYLEPVGAAETIGVAGGTGVFNLADTDLDRIADGFSHIHIGRADGTGLLDAGSYTFSDDVTLRNAGAGSAGVRLQGGLSPGPQHMAVSSAGEIVLTSGTYSGNCAFNGAVRNAGAILAPGASPGRLDIAGDYVQEAGGTLEMELGGNSQGIDYDLLAISGTANLGGTLNVTLFGGFVPADGDTFDILTFTSATGGFIAPVSLPPGFSHGIQGGAYRLVVGSLPAPPPPLQSPVPVYIDVAPEVYGWGPFPEVEPGSLLRTSLSPTTTGDGRWFLSEEEERSRARARLTCR